MPDATPARALELILGASASDERGVTVFVGRLLGAAVVGLGLVSLAGWALEQDRLTSFGLGSASLKVNTAVCSGLS